MLHRRWHDASAQAFFQHAGRAARSVHRNADACLQEPPQHARRHHHAALALGHDGFRAACQLGLVQFMVGSCGLLLGQLHCLGQVRRLLHNDVARELAPGDAAAQVARWIDTGAPLLCGSRVLAVAL